MSDDILLLRQAEILLNNGAQVLARPDATITQLRGAMGGSRIIRMIREQYRDLYAVWLSKHHKRIYELEGR